MSKRKSSADLSHGFNASGQRPSVGNLQARALSINHRKPGAMNVRLTSSYRTIQRGHTEKQRRNVNISDAHRSVVKQAEMPKTRFNMANGWKTSRLKHFPVESGRATAASWSYSPSLINKVVSPVAGTNAITWGTDLQSYGYGDALKLRPDTKQQQIQQQEQTQQSLKQCVTTSQQHMPIEQNVGRINHSEAMLNSRIVSSGSPIHRPFVPSTIQGMVVGESSPRKSISPAQQGFALCAAENQQQQQKQISSTAVQEAQCFQDPVAQKAVQISGQSVTDQPNQRAPTPLRHIAPWRIDDSANIPDYESQPIGGRITTIQRPASVLVEEAADSRRQAVSNEQVTTLGHVSGNQVNIDQWQNKEQQQPHQQQSHQQQQYLYPNRQGPSTAPTLQNPQQMCQQMRTNTIHQQEMQRRTLSQQQKIMAIPQQRAGQWPLAQQLQMHPEGQMHTNYYSPQQIHFGQVPNSYQASRMALPQNIHTNEMRIPHHRMLMQQRNAGYRPLQMNPQGSWIHNHQVIGEQPGVREKGWPSDDIMRSEQSKQNEAPLIANQCIAQQQPGLQLQQGMRCPQYAAAAHQYSPILRMQQKQNPVSSQQYPAVRQERQTSVPEVSMIQHHHQTQQQQLTMNPQFDPPGIHRVSQTTKKKYPEFTADMIRDQELLVGSMRQQKIPDDIMRRQFDALLSEQRRLLVLLDPHVADEKIIGMPARRSSRVLREDQRPDWMERITPPRMTIQQMQNSGCNLNEQTTTRDQVHPRTDPEQIEEYGQRQQQIFHDASNGLQYLTIPPQQLHKLRHQDMYNSWQYSTDLQASPPYTSVSLPQVPSPPQATLGWSQKNNDQQSNPQCGADQVNNFQVQSHQQQLHQQQPFQFQKQCHLQQMQHNQQQQTINCQHDQQVGHRIPDHHRQHDHKLNMHREQYGHNFKPDEPSSLLKLREFKKYIRPQRQNNGLQNAETVKAALEALKNPEAKKGFEYLADLGKKVIVFKLNGTQDSSELEKILPPPAEYLQRIQQQQQPKVSANGLCNTRNANNPASPPISFPAKIDHVPVFGYPRQYYPSESPQGTNKLTAEKENGTVAGTTQQEHAGALFRGYSQAMNQFYSPSQVNARSQYPLLQPDDRGERLKIPGDGKNPIKSIGTIPIMSYKFDGSGPQYQQQMEQFYRNRQTLKNSGEVDVTPLTQGQGQGDIVQSEVLSDRPESWPDHAYHQGSTKTAGGMVATSQQSAMLAYGPNNVTAIAQNDKQITQSPGMQQATIYSNQGQPEIREPKTIGGLTYLARKVDYIQNPPLIAPHTLIASKYLQPLVSVN